MLSKPLPAGSIHSGFLNSHDVVVTPLRMCKVYRWRRLIPLWIFNLNSDTSNGLARFLEVSTICRSDNRWRGCGAALLNCNPVVIVTAAHCVQVKTNKLSEHSLSTGCLKLPQIYTVITYICIWRLRDLRYIFALIYETLCTYKYLYYNSILHMFMLHV